MTNKFNRISDPYDMEFPLVPGSIRNIAFCYQCDPHFETEISEISLNPIGSHSPLSNEIPIPTHFHMAFSISDVRKPRDRTRLVRPSLTFLH